MEDSKRKREATTEVEEHAAPRKAARKKKYRYECSADGCTNKAQKGGVCVKHGAKVEYKRCSVEGCTNGVIKGGVCVKHGAKLKLCSFDGCTTQAKKGGVCVKHGAKVEYKRCSTEGCTSLAQKGGVCVKHGAKRKLCGFEGCTNKSHRRGICQRHGAYRNPTDESTAFTSHFGSEFDKTTLTHPNQRTPAPSTSQGNVPEEVAVCVVIASNHVEV